MFTRLWRHSGDRSNGTRWPKSKGVPQGKERTQEGRAQEEGADREQREAEQIETSAEDLRSDRYVPCTVLSALP